MHTVEQAPSSAEYGLASIEQDFPFGWRIGEYHLDGIVAIGALGTVYHGRSTKTGVRVAVKVLHDSQIAIDDDDLQCYARKTRVLSMLDVPGSLCAHNVGRTPDGRLYMVSELLVGVPMSTFLTVRGPMSLGKALAVLRKVAETLTKAHDHQIMHGDVKASNVYLAEQGRRIVLLDFGLAELTLASPMASDDCIRPPELRRGRATPRSDVFGMAVLATELLSGRPPAESSDFDEQATLVSMDSERLSPFEKIPEPVQAVLDRALSPDPKDRYAQPLDFVRAFHRGLRTGRRVRTKQSKEKSAAESVLSMAVHVEVFARAGEPSESAVYGVEGVLAQVNRVFGRAGFLRVADSLHSTTLAAPLSGDREIDRALKRKTLRTAHFLAAELTAACGPVTISLTIAQEVVELREGRVCGGSALDAARWAVCSPRDNELFLAAALVDAREVKARPAVGVAGLWRVTDVAV